MANTPNYNLKKVEYTEIADIPGHFNANFDTIDAGMKSNADAAVTAEDNAKSFTSGLIGSLSGLLTTAKTNIVAAINEIFQDLAAHKAEDVTQVMVISRDLSLTGIQTVTTNAGKKPKSIIAYCAVSTTDKASWGVWSLDATERCVYTHGDTGKFDVSGYMFCLSDLSTTNRTLGRVQSPAINSFEINWTKTGSGATGNVDIILLISYHGE